MITPPSLTKGDNIAIVAPARFIAQEKYESICSLIQGFGYNPILGETTHLENSIFAGSDRDRAADFQAMINRRDIKAIFCVRGGYGCVRMVEMVDFLPLLSNPKWVVGFSDITVLHSAINNCGVESIHGQMPVNFDKPYAAVERIFKLLEGTSPEYRFVSTFNRRGSVEAEVCGGNLSVLCSLMGTRFQQSTYGKILFIEDIGEPLYRIDRMIQHLRVAGVLKNLAGLVCGYFTAIEDTIPSYGCDYRHIILDAVKEYRYPVAFDFKAGHEHPNLPLIMGRKASLTVEDNSCKFLFT